MVRLVPGALAATFALAGATAAMAQCNSQEPVRIELRMFKYYGAESGPAQDKFSLFYQILIEKLKHIQDEANSPDVDTKYLDKLKIIPDFTKLELPPKEIDKLKAIWDSVPALFLLSGALDLEGTTYYVDSSIYWGGLKPAGLHDYIYARMPVTPAGQRNALDTHSLITFFALAMDAKRRGCHSSVVLHLLEHAEEKAKDLERRNELDGDLVKLKAFIEDQIASSIKK